MYLLCARHSDAYVMYINRGSGRVQWEVGAAGWVVFILNERLKSLNRLSHTCLNSFINVPYREINGIHLSLKKDLCS